MEIEVAISQWAWDGGSYTGGRHTIDNPSGKLLKAVAAAEAAGDLTVKASKDERAKMARHVESDAASLKAQEKAMADGRWHLGAHEAFLVDAGHRLSDPATSDTMRGYLEAQVPISEAYLKAREEHDHENAVRVALGQPLTEVTGG